MKFLFKGIIYIIYIYFGFRSPFFLIFPDGDRYWFYIDIIFSLCIFINAVMNFQDKKASKGLSKFWIFSHFWASIPFVHLLTPILGMDWILPIDFLEFSRLIAIIDVLYEKKVSSKVENTREKISVFILLTSLSVHWIGIVWVFLGGISIQKEPDLITIYNKAIYWTITTLTTIGYGDITPTNNVQRLFNIFVMILGAGFYGYIIGTISKFLNNLDHARNTFEDKMEKIHTFIKYRNFPNDLREKIFNYYNFIWETRRGYDEIEIMSELPNSLRMKIALFLNRSIFERIPIFQDAQEDLINEIVLLLKPMIFIPGDIIFRKGDSPNGMYFISNGLLELVNDETGEVFVSMSEGGFFGELALLQNSPRTATVRAAKYSDLYFLDKQHFLSVIERYPKFALQVREMAKYRTNFKSKRGSKKKAS
ncbi:MAG: cyclic nucleotide-binding domain-containing protein [Leptospiraceae bacterium]|nr:cyclic nucleotide-binding domain-containing protein [Leptospiraceae bacterium]